MKLIIDIPEEVKADIDNGIVRKHIDKIFLAMANGTPIPDNATNGDVIKAMFPKAYVDDYDYGKDPVIDVYGIDDTEYVTFRKAWWNAQYQKGGK